MQQLRWWGRDPFYAKLYEIQPNQPRNRTLAEIHYHEGKFAIKVPHLKNVNFEKQIRYMCKLKEAQMREEVARWVARKLN
jgi:hypothetical protein